MIARLLETGLGIWLMAAPAVLAYGPPAAHSDRIAGPLIASFGIIAAWRIARPLRHLNLLIGAWLVLAPLVVGFGGAAAADSVVVGLAVAALSRFGGGAPDGAFGGGWSSLWPPSRAAGEQQRRVFESIPETGADTGSETADGITRNV